MGDLEYTGEFVIPELQGMIPVVMVHVAHYQFARPFCVGKWVLDLGCGSGYGTAMLNQVAFTACGVDRNTQAIEYARKQHGDGIWWREADIEEVPLSFGHTWDVVTMFEVIEHLQNPSAVLSKLPETEAELVLITTPAPPMHGSPFHMREYDADEFRDLLVPHFKHVEIWGQRGRWFGLTTEGVNDYMALCILE